MECKIALKTPRRTTAYGIVKELSSVFYTSLAKNEVPLDWSRYAAL